MKINKKHLKTFAVFLLVAVLIEIFGFNYEFFFSMGDKPKSVKISTTQNIEDIGGGVYKIDQYFSHRKEQADKEAYFQIDGINSNVNYIYLDVTPMIVKDNNEAWFDIQLYDEGFSDYYEAQSVRFHPNFEKTKYVKIHTYGKLKSIRLYIHTDEETHYDRIKVNDIKVNAKVPMFFSVLRVLLIFMAFMFVWAFRPSSKLYKHSIDSTSKKLRYLRLAFIFANVVFLFILLFESPVAISPANNNLRQYQLLAEAICNGQTNIYFKSSDMIKYVENPYDLVQRVNVLERFHWGDELGPWWDIAYFQGKFYVYFGVVPALLFFVPVYALTKVHMLASVVILIVCAVIVLLAYSFVEQVIKVFFPKTPYGISLFLSIVLANGCGILYCMQIPIIYDLVIIISVMFVLAGLTLWLKAKDLLKTNPASKKINVFIALGSLCMALVAGCRPQFILASFMIVPLFWDTAVVNKKLVVKGNVSKYLSVIIPYSIVAAGLMYYNYIRFKSPFDFGANYNLTTNNMNLRGFNLQRLVDAFYMFFIQPPVLSIKFPFVNQTKFISDYIGMTIEEPRYGGVLFTNAFTLFTLLSSKVKDQLKQKKLLGVQLCLLAFPLITACADSEMAGILQRYDYDFVYMLLIAAIFVFLCLYEKYGNNKTLISAMIVLGLSTVIVSYLVGFNDCYFQPGETNAYYFVRSLFI